MAELGNIGGPCAYHRSHPALGLPCCSRIA